MTRAEVRRDTGISFDLSRDLVSKGFLARDGAVSINVTANTDPAALRKLEANAPLGSDEFTVAQFSVEAKPGTSDNDIRFLHNGKVSFSGSVNDYAALAIYPDPTSDDFKNAIAPIDATGLQLQRDSNLTWCVLRWGGDEKAAANGSIAFAAGSGDITFSGEQHGELFFGVLRQFPRTTLIRDALTAVVKSWRLPSQVETELDLEPGTYLLAEVGGSLKVGLDVTFGHVFNWVRQTKFGQLTGDVGLKLQLGLDTSLGLSAQGKYAIVVGREALDASNRVVRVRVYRLRASEFDFALSLAAAATLKLPVSDDYHDLIEAAVGVHGLQILKKLESWTEPNAIPEFLLKLGDNYVSDFLTKVTGLTLEQAKARMSAFIQKWNDLPHSVASMFAKEAAQAIPDFTTIRSLAQVIANQDHDAFVSVIAPLLGNGFDKTPALRWLESIAEEGALTLLQDIPGFKRIRNAAQATLDFLSGSSVEEFLNKIMTELEQRIGLDTILKLTQNNFAGMDQLLLSRLTEFLDRIPAFKEILSLQQNIKDLLTNNKIEAFYKKAIDALTETYTAKFNVTYQSTTSDTALVDVSFDFSKPAAAGMLAQLLSGNLDDILSRAADGVKVNSGTLTHSLKRTTHVDLTLPFLKTSGDWIGTATATFNAVDEDKGRLSFFQLDAANQVISRNSVFSSRNWRATTLSLSGFLPQVVQDTGGIVVHSTTAVEQAESATAVSSFRFEVKNMTRKDLDNTVGPPAVQFLKKSFQTQADFDRWADLGKLLLTPSNAIASLDVSITPRVPFAWFNNSPIGDKDARYMDMSKRIQAMLKTLIPQFVFRDPKSYEKIIPSSAVLVYQSIQPANSIIVDEDRIIFTNDDVYWDPPFPPEFDAMTGAQTTQDRLTAVMNAAENRLMAAGLTSTAKFYRASDQQEKRFADATQETGKLLLQGLLNMERLVTTTARDAGVAIAKFQQLKQTSPAEAIKQLASAGKLLTSAFNTDLATAILDDVLLRLSPLIFADAAVALDPTIPTFSDDAVLNVTVLKPGVKLPDAFPDLKLDPKDIQVSLNAQSLSTSR